MSGSKETVTEIAIAAPIERVWAVLTAFNDYGWNPVVSFYGTPRVGERVWMKIRMGVLPMLTPVTIEVLDPHTHEVCWRGGPRGVLHGRHYFRLRRDDADPERTIMTQGEEFSGLAVGPAWPLLRGTLERIYATTNEALRVRAETARRR